METNTLDALDASERFAVCEATLGEASVADLVQRAQTGDNEAFGALVSRYEPMVQAVCRQRLRDHSEVQEVAQDVFIKAFQKLAQLREPAAFAGWLKSIAVRQSLNRCTRREPARSVEAEILEGLDSSEQPPLHTILQREQAAQVHAGLGRLATLDRSTLVAFYLQGQSLNEMSDHFAAPIGTIKRRLHVARKRLAQELECLQSA